MDDIVIFDLKLWESGRLEIEGYPEDGKIPDILRWIAEAVESGDIDLKQEVIDDGD